MAYMPIVQHLYKTLLEYLQVYLSLVLEPTSWA